jgi:hypothetical protein
MRHAKLSEDLTTRYDSTGGPDGHGCQVVGEDLVVRWFTHDELAAMRGVGDYHPADGFTVFDDDAPHLPADSSGPQ